jgi:hypothetical protein
MEDGFFPARFGYAGGFGHEPALAGIHPGHGIDIHRLRPLLQKALQTAGIVGVVLRDHHGIYGIRIHREIDEIVREISPAEAGVEKKLSASGFDQKRRAFRADQSGVLL